MAPDTTALWSMALWSTLSTLLATLVVLLCSALCYQLIRRVRRPRSSRAAVELQPRVSTGAPSATAGVLLRSREFVTDMSKLAEHIMMNDVPPGFWTSFDEAAVDAAERLRLELACREPYPFWAPDKCGDQVQQPASKKESCAVRLRRATWTIAFKKKYQPSVADWIDSGA